jgi:hypothetical protein
VRFLELELERADDLSALRLRDVLSFCAPTDAMTVVLDRPEGSAPRLTRLEDRVTIPLEGFHPRLLADTPDGDILAIGTAPDHNGILFTPEGRVLHRYRFGDGIADIGYDPDGNIVVLRPVPPLLFRFGPDGERVLDDPAVEDIHDVTQQRDGFMLLIQNDGAVWLNLEEKYDHDGKLVATLDPAALFGAGRVGADLIGWEAIVVLNARGEMTALYGAGARRSVKLPDAAIRKALGRPLSADLDLFVTKGEKLILLATDRSMLLRFRILSE